MKRLARNAAAALGNEEGFALVVAMLLLLALTAMGSAALMTTSVESKIAGADLLMKQTFYSADAGATQALHWLSGKSSAPGTVSASVDTVKSAGDSDSSNDKNGVNYDGALAATNYRYAIHYGSSALVAGSSTQYREFYYDVDSEADAVRSTNSEVEALMSKVYRIEY